MLISIAALWRPAPDLLPRVGRLLSVEFWGRVVISVEWTVLMEAVAQTAGPE